MASKCILVLILRLSLLFVPTYEQNYNSYDYDAYGERLAMNEYFGVLACNDYKQFNVFFAPYSSASCTMSFSYSLTNQYIYSVAIGSKQNSSQLYFVANGEYLTSGTSPSILSFVSIYRITSCGGSVSQSRWTWGQAHQETIVLGIDPYGTTAFVVDPTVLLRIGITTNTAGRITFGNTFYSTFAPRSIVVDETQTAHVAGYSCTGILTCYVALNRIWWADPTNAATVYTNSSIVGNQALPLGALFTSYARASDLSLTINYDSQQLLFGVPYLDTVYLYKYWSGFTSPSRSYDWIANFTYHSLGVGFGKSVTWLNNNTIATLAYSLSTLPWSTSQVQIHKLDGLLSANRSVPYPYFVYPNNQQVLIGSHENPLPTALLSIISWSPNSLAVLTDARNVWLLPVSAPGFSSSQPLSVGSLPDVTIYTSQACIPGTQKNESTSGPCFICPTNTKNNGSFGIQCHACLNGSFCPLGSIDDIVDDSTTSHDQADPYPGSPESTNFDDILLTKVFSFGKTTHCLLISPLLWASVMIGFASLMVIIIAALNFCPKRHKQRQALKNAFTRFDLIGEGELWIGGLVSLSTAVLVTFAYIFSSSFVKLYPIEKVSNSESSIICDPTMSNAKFTSSLQFLSIKKLDDEQPMFDMLDSQSFTLTMEFVNTGFTCDNFSMQQNMRSRSQNILWTSFNCSTKSNNATLIVSTVLPAHELNIQYNLTGPYFIGGVRVCLTGDTSIDDSYTLRQLDFCQFFSTDNETLASSPYITAEITKVINHTAGFYDDDPSQYSGLWLPTMTMDSYSDALLYSQQGDYTRYLVSQTILIIDITETKFYVKNFQEPIAKQTEIIFHTILFTTLCIELFGLVFLIIKLTIVPLVHLIQRRVLKMNNKVGIVPDETEHKEAEEPAKSLESMPISIISPPMDAIVIHNSNLLGKVAT